MADSFDEAAIKRLRMLVVSYRSQGKEDRALEIQTLANAMENTNRSLKALGCRMVPDSVHKDKD